MYNVSIEDEEKEEKDVMEDVVKDCPMDLEVLFKSWKRRGVWSGSGTS